MNIWTHTTTTTKKIRRAVEEPQNKSGRGVWFGIKTPTVDGCLWVLELVSRVSTQASIERWITFRYGGRGGHCEWVRSHTIPPPAHQPLKHMLAFGAREFCIFLQHPPRSLDSVSNAYNSPVSATIWFWLLHPHLWTHFKKCRWWYR